MLGGKTTVTVPHARRQAAPPTVRENRPSGSPLGNHLSHNGSPAPRSTFGTHPDNWEQTPQTNTFFSVIHSLSLSLSFGMNNPAMLLITNSLMTQPSLHTSPVDARPWKSPIKLTSIIGDILRGRLHQHPVCLKSVGDKPRSRERTSHGSLCQSQPISQGLLSQPGPCSTRPDGNSRSMENRNV